MRPRWARALALFRSDTRRPGLSRRAWLGTALCGRVRGRGPQRRRPGHGSARVDRGALTVLTASGEVRAVVSAADRARARSAPAPDRRRLGRASRGHGGRCAPEAQRHRPRQCGRCRRAAGARRERRQGVRRVLARGAAFAPRLLERFVVLAWQSGAAPVAVLTKADIARDLAGAVAAAERLIGGGDVVAVSSLTGAGMDELGAFLETRGRRSRCSGPRARASRRSRTGSAAGRSSSRRARSATTARVATRRRPASSCGFRAGRCSSTRPGLRALGLFGRRARRSATPSGRSRSWRRRAVSPTARTGASPGARSREAIAAGGLDVDRYESFEKLRREQRHLAARARSPTSAPSNARGTRRSRRRRASRRSAEARPLAPWLALVREPPPWSAGPARRSGR